VRNWKWPFVRTGILLGMLVLMSPEGHANCHGFSAAAFPNIYLALEAVRAKCGVPIGFEKVVSDPDNTAILLDLDANDAALVFDKLVSQRPAYGWSIEGGVYDLYPKLKADRLSGLIIRTFVLEEATRTQALTVLDKLPEVQKWHTRRHEYGGVLISQSGISPAEPRISLMLKNVSLRTILNKLSLSLGSGPRGSQWSIVHYGEGNKHTNISF
jgi:hypothetical protein